MFTGHVPLGSATRRRLPLEEREAKVFRETRCVDKGGSDASGGITADRSGQGAGPQEWRVMAAAWLRGVSGAQPWDGSSAFAQVVPATGRMQHQHAVVQSQGHSRDGRGGDAARRPAGRSAGVSAARLHRAPLRLMTTTAKTTSNSGSVRADEHDHAGRDPQAGRMCHPQPLATTSAAIAGGRATCKSRPARLQTRELACAW